MITAYVNHPKFQAICASLSNEDAEKVVACFPDLFRDALEFGAPTEPTGPTVAKTQPKPKAPVDLEALKARALAWVADRPGQRSEDVAHHLCADKDATRKALDKLVNEKKLYHDGGSGRAKRYLPKPAAQGEVGE